MKELPVILVIDDNENNRLLYKDLLEGAGCQVIEAADASRGMALAREAKPDVIIMDLQLPDMRGYEAAKLLRQDTATGAIPIVFVTASVLARDKNEMDAIANSTAINKPIDTRTFAKAITRFVP
jgi:two-component system, cell cycle response regulator DivK